jgi:hypothetical protein
VGAHLEAAERAGRDGAVKSGPEGLDKMRTLDKRHARGGEGVDLAEDGRMLAAERCRCKGEGRSGPARAQLTRRGPVLRRQPRTTC